MNRSVSKGRVLAMGILLVLLLGIYLYNLYDLQIIKGQFHGLVDVASPLLGIIHVSVPPMLLCVNLLFFLFSLSCGATSAIKSETVELIITLKVEKYS